MSHTTFPSTLPIPQDDGACSHLAGSVIPSVSLPSTSGTAVDLSTLPGRTILFCYPRTGAPGEAITDDWNAIPGARGCTPQACSFRDETQKLYRLGVQHLYGLSTQDTAYQQEAKERLHLPFDLLSDEKLGLVDALKLPLFEWHGQRLVKRLALAIRDGRVEQVWYPVFPPDKNAADVVTRLESKQEQPPS
ncbi:redoxin family protein [Amniculicola lignicola CBS 123094]|uniref:Redoxin family protein n=1 Tax=Amniculicola lignicola CBS 123094 TaxID=1392246 RepID=A0A6A5WB71_9PLEO|nr:redoxin family protein [Amniculicola lignicola CBS 123094]